MKATNGRLSLKGKVTGEDMRKIKIFGRLVPAWVIATLLIGGAAVGIVVKYLSNTITLTVETKKPIEIKFTDVSSGLQIIDDNTAEGTIYAGDTFWFKYEVTNHANNEIPRYPVVLVSSNQSLSAGLSEVEQIIYYDANYPNGLDITDMVYCVNSDGTLTELRSCPSKGADEVLELFFDNNDDGVAQPYPITAGATWWYKIEVKTSPGAWGQTFTIKYEEHLELP